MESGRQEVYAAQASSEQAKAEEEKRKQEVFEAWVEENSDYLAQMFFGSRVIAEKNGYTKQDFETYAWAAFNRSDARGVDLKEVIFEAHNGVRQFVAADPHNTILLQYKDWGKEFLIKWKTEERPCDIGYQYAELVPQGIFLKNDFNADGYARRWRAA